MPTSELTDDDLTSLEADVRLANGREIAILGVVAAGIVLLVRLTQRSQERKEMHDTAVATLTESGEFFFAPVENTPRNASIAGS